MRLKYKAVVELCEASLSAGYLLLAIRNQMSESFIQSPELVSPLLAIPLPHSTAGKEFVGLCV